MKRNVLQLILASLLVVQAVSCSSGKDEPKEPVTGDGSATPDAPPSQLPEQPASETTPPPSTEMNKKEDKKLDHRKKKAKKKKH